MGMDYSQIKVKKHGDKNITIYYEDYEIDTNINMESVSRYSVPKVDSNGKKINMFMRDDLWFYIIQNYDLLSLSGDAVPIKEDEVKKYFTNLTICGEKEKSKFLNKKYSNLIYILFFIFVLFNFGAIIGVLVNHYLPGWSIWFILIPLILILLSFIANKNMKEEDETAEIYSGEVNVYDKKIESDGDSNLYYYVRIWNNDKHVLLHWFPVSKKVYKKIEKGTLFLTIRGDNCSVNFEPIENVE